MYGYTFIYNGNMGSGLFYNVPYFRLRLTAFYDQPAVHLHVSGRQEHCIIMSFPAPKCYFTGRGSFLKLPHFYNFLNFYSRHYYQQDFITYLECKQVWVMTPPPHCLPEIILLMVSLPSLCSCKRKRTNRHTLKHAHKSPTKLARMCALYPIQLKASHLLSRVHACVSDKRGVGEKERVLYSTHINHVEEKWANVRANSSPPHPEKMKFTGIPIKTAIIQR